MFRRFIPLLCLAFVSFGYSPGLIGAEVTPELMKRVEGLPKWQRDQLLRQYGLDPDEFGAMADQPLGREYELGAPGEPLSRPGRPTFQENSAFEREAMLEMLMRERLQNEMAEEDDEELKRYGLEFFNDDSMTFTQTDNVAVPDSYLLGVGDELIVSVFGSEQIKSRMQVDREGAVSVPKIGVISVAGMTFGQAKSAIESRLESQIIGAKAYLSLSRLKHISIYLAGEVVRPGGFSVPGITTLTQALYLGAGISEIGSLRNIQLKRDGKVVHEIDLYDLMLNGDRSGDVRLRSGDVIFVPTMGPNVSLSGEVLRPAIYELIENETIDHLLEMAGGLTSRAYRRSANLIRYDRVLGQPVVITIDLEKKLSRGKVLHDGDALNIGKATDQISNTVEVSGAVIRPGNYAWIEGNRVSTYLKTIDQDLELGADLSVGIIVRRKNDAFDVEVLPFSIMKAIASPGSDEDLLLNNHDNVIVLPMFDSEMVLLGADIDEENIGEQLESEDSNLLANNVDPNAEVEEESGAEKRRKLLDPIIEKLKTQARSGEPAAIVEIQGAIRIPGEYPLLASGDLNFLIALAGGMVDGAYQRKIEVRRLLIDSVSGVETEFYNLDLTNESVNFVLESKDLVRVDFLPDWNPDRTVEITGEVRFPGIYSISRGETLSSVLNRAGGLTEEAYPLGLKYLSKKNKELQLERARLLVSRYEREMSSRQSVSRFNSFDNNSNTNSFGSSDRESYQETLENSIEGRLVVETEKILAGDETADLILQDGDKIEVPVFIETVSVVGETFEPGAFRYVQSRGVKEYLDLAAGLTPRANKKSIYIINPDGSVKPLSRRKTVNLFRFSNLGGTQEVLPGSVIVVPTNYDYQPNLEKYRSVTSVVFESVTSLAALLSIQN